MSRKPFRLLSLMLVVVFVSGAGLIVWGSSVFNAPGPHETDIVVVLPKGASVGQISQILEREGVLQSPSVFRLVVRLAGQSGALRAGEYEIPAQASMRALMTLLVDGETVVRRLTLPEGLSTVEALQVVGEADGLVGALPTDTPEGSLLPETYHYSYGDERAELVARMQRAMSDLMNVLWPNRADDLPFDTWQDAVVLASIVEKETAVPDERPRIAGVFVNRLRRGMRLQSDPTVVYAITGGGPLGRRLTRQDLTLESPYNTYRVAGLPPTPIANPGRASLEAVLNPAVTDELYFVADGTGGHAFAKTLAEHQDNVRRWRRIRDAQD